MQSGTILHLALLRKTSTGKKRVTNSHSIQKPNTCQTYRHRDLKSVNEDENTNQSYRNLRNRQIKSYGQHICPQNINIQGLKNRSQNSCREQDNYKLCGWSIDNQEKHDSILKKKTNTNLTSDNKAKKSESNLHPFLYSIPLNYSTNKNTCRKYTHHKITMPDSQIHKSFRSNNEEICYKVKRTRSELQQLTAQRENHKLHHLRDCKPLKFNPNSSGNKAKGIMNKINFSQNCKNKLGSGLPQLEDQKNVFEIPNSSEIETMNILQNKQITSFANFITRNKNIRFSTNRNQIRKKGLYKIINNFSLNTYKEFR